LVSIPAIRAVIRLAAAPARIEPSPATISAGRLPASARSTGGV